MEQKEQGRLGEFGSLAGSATGRSQAGFDVLRPWKVISPNNIYIIYLSVLLFAVYAFAR